MSTPQITDTREILKALTEQICDLSEGNPGAINVMCMIALHRPHDAEQVLANLKEMRLTGSRIWVAYKDICKCDLDSLCERVLAKEQSFIEAVKTVVER